MAERRQPDYDFFGPGPGQPGGGPGQPPPEGAWTPPPAPPRPPAQWPSMYGPQTPGAPETGPLPAAAFMVPRRSRALTIIIVAAVVICTIVVMGVVSAIAIPVFLAQRLQAEWKSTTISAPQTFDGATRTEVPSSVIPDDAPAKTEKPQVAAYLTQGGKSYVVLAAKGKSFLTTEDQLNARRELETQLAQNGLQVTLDKADPGPLGGWFGCDTPARAKASVCLATDSAALVLVVVEGSTDPAADARRLREAIEKRG